MSKRELSLVRNAGGDAHMDASAVREELERCSSEIASFAETLAKAPKVSFKDFEAELKPLVFALARAAITLFLVLREEYVVMVGTPTEIAGRRFRRAPAIWRNLATLFGVVRYRRTYMREVAKGSRHGFFPLDLDLGLVSDRFSWNVFSHAVLLATKLSFAEARATLARFVPNAPSTEVIEQAVLGLGRYTGDWFREQPAPEGDGEVLVVMIDSKGAPMATSEELRRRRGKRRRRRFAASPRHRGRQLRRRYPKKPRRKKGDKSKNAKMATMVVMYTLKRSGKKLLGPLNRRIYASFGPKRHAFDFARREANKRGFVEGSGKLVQLVTDGDSDLATYGAELFPSAIHTVDIIHVIEKLWKAGECIFREGSDELATWVEAQKTRLYEGQVADVFEELCRQLDSIPKTGPGNKGKRARLYSVCRYIVNRGLAKMNYDELLAKDLEISTGNVEGAIKNVLGRRFDHGGSRWIQERAEALLHLRCIAVNGDWDAFMNYVHDRVAADSSASATIHRLQSRTPAALPVAAKAA